MKPEIDPASATWKAVIARLNERILSLRQRNDGALDIVQTAHLRGRLAELKELLALGDPNPAQTVNEQ